MGALIFHETSFEIALVIAKSRVLLANDPHCRCANFYMRPTSTSQVENSGVALAFQWEGQIVKRCDTGQMLPANTLYHISTNSNGSFDENSYWCSRIYPETNHGLSLVGIIYKQELASSLSLRQRINLYGLNETIRKRTTIAVKR